VIVPVSSCVISLSDNEHVQMTTKFHNTYDTTCISKYWLHSCKHINFGKHGNKVYTTGLTNMNKNINYNVYKEYCSFSPLITVYFINLTITEINND